MSRNSFEIWIISFSRVPSMITVLDIRIDLIGSRDLCFSNFTLENYVVFKMRLCQFVSIMPWNIASRPLSGRKFGTIRMLIYSVHMCTFGNDVMMIAWFVTLGRYWCCRDPFTFLLLSLCTASVLIILEEWNTLWHYTYW